MNKFEEKKKELMIKLGLCDVERLSGEMIKELYGNPEKQEEFRLKGYYYDGASGRWTRKIIFDWSDEQLMQYCMLKSVEVGEIKEYLRRNTRNTTILAVFAVLGVIFGVITALVTLL